MLPFLGIALFLLIQDLRLEIPTNWYTKYPNSQCSTHIQFVAVPSPTVRMQLPSRLDLGRDRPFTTEEVENVKTFLGILCLLLTLGPTLMVDAAVSGFLPNFSAHIDHSILYCMLADYNYWLKSILSGNSLTSLLIVLLILLYLCLLRPFVYDYIPGILKRKGLGMIFILLSALCTLSMDTFGHLQTSNSTMCFLSDEDDFPKFNSIHMNNSYMYNITHNTTFNWISSSTSLNISSYFLIIQGSLNAIGSMLFYIGVYEFMCAQSPHAMKGLIIGTYQTYDTCVRILEFSENNMSSQGCLIREPCSYWYLLCYQRCFSIVRCCNSLVPFIQWNLPLRFPSCGFVYYLINIVIGLQE